jgi:hypothetical protein
MASAAGTGAPMTPIQQFRAHPAYGQLLERYREARAGWWQINDVARDSLKQDQRGYCDAFVRLNYPPVTWTASTTNDVPIEHVIEQAWLDSMPDAD